MDATCGKCGQEVIGQLFYTYDTNPWATDKEPKLRCATCHSLEVAEVLAPHQDRVASLEAEVERLKGENERLTVFGGAAVAAGGDQVGKIARLENRVRVLEAFVRAEERWHALDDADYGPECDRDKELAWNDRSTAYAAVGELGEEPT